MPSVDTQSMVTELEIASAQQREEGGGGVETEGGKKQFSTG